MHYDELVKKITNSTVPENAARSSIQKFDNDYDVIFMTYKCYIALVAMV